MICDSFFILNEKLGDIVKKIQGRWLLKFGLIEGYTDCLKSLS